MKLKSFLIPISNISQGKKNLLLSISSGIIAFGAFPPLGFSLLAWFALVPLFYVINKSGYKGAFWYSYLAGTVFFSGVLYWLTIVSVPGYILLVLVMGIVYAFFGLVAKIVMKYSMNLLILPFAWVVFEYVRGNLFTGFPWALLGHSQYENLNLIQVADISGVYGVSFILVVFNAALYGWISGAQRKISYMMFALLLIIAATSYGMYRIGDFPAGESAKISVVQGDISQSLKWDSHAAGSILEKYSVLTREAAIDSPDIIIWPETSYPYLIGKDDSSVLDMEELSSETGIPLLVGAVYETAGKYYNTAALFDGTEGIALLYRKLHLVPFGEYVPFEKYLASLRKYIDKPIGSFVAGTEYELFPIKSTRVTDGPESSVVRRTVFHKLGVMICFEDVFPYVARNFVLKGANILVNITNDAWFGNTAASRQHLQSSVFRAVENRVPVVRAANTGISAFIDFSGKILSKVEVDGREIFVSGYDTHEVKTTPGRSYYTIYGDTFVCFSGLFLILLLIVEYLSFFRKRD